MSDQPEQPRGRGRGYGRARPGQQQQAGGAAGGPPRPPGGRGRPGGGPPPQQQPGGPPHQQARPQPQGQARGGPPPPAGAGAWGRPQGPPPQAAAAPPPQPTSTGGAVPRPQLAAPQQQQQQPAIGRGARHGEGGAGVAEGVVTGAGEGNGNGGRTGNVRGRTTARTRADPNYPCTPLPKGQNKKGTSGQECNLIANYLRILKPRLDSPNKENWHLWQYRVDFAPECDVKGKRRFLVRNAVKEVLVLGYLFDGTLIFTPHLFHDESNEYVVKDSDDTVYRITVRRVGEVQLIDYQYLQIFNIIMRKCLTLMGMTLVGRNYFNPSMAVIHQEDNIELWPGYFTSIRQHQYDILLNVDLSFKFMNTDNVFRFMCEHRGSRDQVREDIVGRIVLTRYNNKTYRIDDVDFKQNPKSEFQMKDGSRITYKKYFEQKYNVRITNDNQPLLVSRSSKREMRAGMPETILLVPEICHMTGLSERQRENFKLMKKLADDTRIDPRGRIERLNMFIQKINQKPEIVEELRKWDVGFEKNLIRFKGRVLPREQIFCGGGRPTDKYTANQDADWTRDVRAQPMFLRAELNRLLVITPQNFKRPTDDFVGMLRKCATGMSWKLGNSKTLTLNSDRTADYLACLEESINVDAPSFILFTLPNNNQDRYSSIKKKCYVDKAVPCQMIVSRNLTSKGVMSIATKVAIQINCKMGGAPWAVNIPVTGLMIVGYDACRDTANKKKSFGAFVASIDRNHTRYYSAVYEHANEEELSNQFAAFMLLACVEYKKINGNFPEKIAVFRDGVGEGQLPYVKEHEIADIKTKLKAEIYNTPNNPLRMVFIVVSKRINTRIFSENAQNPTPGTIADDVIVEPQRYDFYLVSQCVRQGTVSPTSYNILEDTMGLDADKLQRLTYKLTHMYYNWSGTVRVPAPCQYAHKLAFMTSQHLHRPAHGSLATILYYL